MEEKQQNPARGRLCGKERDSFLKELRKLGGRGQQAQGSVGQESGFYHPCDKTVGFQQGRDMI